MIVSPPAPAALDLPAISLAAALNSKDSTESKTNPFKDVFDSLTLFDDQHESGSQEKHAAVPKSSTKKELPERQSSRTDKPTILQTPIVPQTPRPNLPKPSLMLPHVTGRSGEAPGAEATKAQLTVGPSSAQISVEPVRTVLPKPVGQTKEAPPEAALPAISFPIRTAAPAVRHFASSVTEQPSSKDVSRPLAPAPQISGSRDDVSAAQSSTNLANAGSVPSAPAPSPQAQAASAPPTKVTPVEPERAEPVRPTTSAPASAEAKPEPALPTVLEAASTWSPAPMPVALEVIDRASATPSPFLAPQQEAPGGAPAPKIPLRPQAENFAFAIRMLGVESSSNQSSVPQSTGLTRSEASVTTSRTPVTQPSGVLTAPQSSDSRQTAPDQTPKSDDPLHDAQPSVSETASVSETEKPAGVGAQPAAQPVAQQASGLTPHWNDAAGWQAPEAGSISVTQEPTEAAHANPPLAAQEAHLLLPEPPKTSTSSEILLHLAETGPSSAAIRVGARAGLVNVSVHASDPVLRESLRSNLGELSTQLNSQGWKTDVTKSAAVEMQSGSQQESHTGEQRGSQQQHNFGGHRQPQRDRRATGGRWQHEFDQQISGDGAHSGGNG